MPTLLDAPVDIYNCILKNCGSFSLLKSLILTCRKFNYAWEGNSSTIIWDVGRADLFAFSDALVAVRATEIVKEAVLAGELPPHPFPVVELCGRPGRYPSCRELKLIFDFEHFVRYVESTKHSRYKRWEDFTKRPWANTPDLQLDRRRRLYSAVYRVLLAGAVLYRAYNEPLIRGETHGPPNFLGTLNDWMAAWRSREDHAFQGFTDAEFDYLRNFPVYNFEAHSAKQPYYQGLVEFFENESNIRLRDEGPVAGPNHLPQRMPKVDDLNPLQRIILQEAIQFAHAYEILTNLSEFYSNGDGLPTRLVYEPEANVIDHAKILAADKAGQLRKVSIVLLGVFRLEGVRMPLDIEVETNERLILNPLNASFPSFQHVDSLLEKLHEHSDQVNNYHPMDPTPYPPLDFVEYIFRTHLNLRFSDDAFNLTSLDTQFDYEIREPEGVFAEPFRGEELFEYASVPRETLGDYVFYYDDG